MSKPTDLLATIAHRLITLGANLAQAVHDRALATPDSDLTRATIDFERASRTARRGILLARELTKPIRAPQAQARRQIIRAVEDTIQREAADDHEVEALEREFLDRLDAPDILEDIDSRPVEDIIKDITRDLGIAHIQGAHHPWKRRTPAAAAELHARAAEPLNRGPATSRQYIQLNQ